MCAKKSKIFKKIFCITDSKDYQKIAKSYGADDFNLRPKKISSKISADIDWLKWAISVLEKRSYKFKYFAILRPTSPFRSVKMIKKAYSSFLKNNHRADSLRAVELSKIHPGKIWEKKDIYIEPIFKKTLKNIPWHSMQYASLPKYYSQNASLEISSYKSFKKNKSISGKKIIPFFTQGLEGFDINNEIDFELAKILFKKSKLIF